MEKLYSQRNSMNFLSLSLSWASGPLQPKSGFLIILTSEIKGLV